MEKSLFEQLGGTYTQAGDYLLPNLTIPEEEQKPIGIWGQRHARYLKQHHKILWDRGRFLRPAHPARDLRRQTETGRQTTMLTVVISFRFLNMDSR